MPEQSRDSRGPMAGRPSIREFQKSHAVRPGPAITPTPVMATRRILLCRGRPRRLGGEQSLDAFPHLTNVADSLYFFVRDTDIEFIFESEKDLDRIHRVDAQFFK